MTLEKKFGEKFMVAFRRYLVLRRYSTEKAIAWMRIEIYEIVFQFLMERGHAETKSETLARISAIEIAKVIQESQEPPNSWTDFGKLLELTSLQILKQLDILYPKPTK